MKTAIKSIIIGLLVFIILPVGMVMAAYGANLTVLNTSATSYDMLACNVSANVDYWADNGYMNASGNDTRVFLGTQAQPHMLADDRVMFAVPSATLTSIPLLLNTGESELTDFYIISGYSANTSVGYYLTNDAANIEPTDNFSVGITAYFDTSTNGTDYILYKQDAFTITGTAGNITASILGLTEELLPNAAGDACAINHEVGAACPNHYQNVDESYSSPSSAENVNSTNGAEQIDYYNIQDGSIPDNAIIDSVTVYFNIYTSVSGASMRPYLRLSGTNRVGSTKGCPVVATTYSESLTRPGGGSWTTADLDDLQVGVGLWTSNTAAVCNQLSVVVAYHYSVTTEIEGHCALQVSSNTTDFWMAIDGVTEDSVTTAGESVVDNANNYYWNYINRMPYVDNITMSIDGVQQLYYDPTSYLITTGNTANIPDRSAGTVNNGMIYFGSNPVGVTVTLGAFESDYSVDSISTAADTDIAPVVTTRVIPVAEAVKLAAMQAKDPILYPMFNAVNGLTTPGIPIMLMYEVFFLAMTGLVMFTFGRFGHMTLMVFAGWAVMGFATAWGVYDFALMIMLILIGIGFIWMQGRQGA